MKTNISVLINVIDCEVVEDVQAQILMKIDNLLRRGLDYEFNFNATIHTDPSNGIITIRNLK